MIIAFPGRDATSAQTMGTPADPTADEGLQLIRAFIKIKDPEQRAQLIRIAERLSGLRPENPR